MLSKHQLLTEGVIPVCWLVSKCLLPGGVSPFFLVCFQALLPGGISPVFCFQVTLPGGSFHLSSQLDSKYLLPGGVSPVCCQTCQLFLVSSVTLYFSFKTVQVLRACKQGTNRFEMRSQKILNLATQIILDLLILKYYIPVLQKSKTKIITINKTDHN